MDYEEKIKALEERCARLERALMTLAVWLHEDEELLDIPRLCKLDKIIKGD